MYGLNNRPFGSGVNYTKKKRLLEVFEQLETPASAVFMRYVANIGRDMGLSSDTTEEQSRIFQACCNLPSFTQKLEQPKVSNWFAWHAMAEKLIPEFYATKALYACVYPNEADPDDESAFDQPTTDPRSQLQAILKSGGGLGLAFKLMKTDLRKAVRILYKLEQPSWSWYADQIKHYKSARDNARYSISMSGAVVGYRGWTEDPHLWCTFKQLVDPEALRFMEI